MTVQAERSIPGVLGDIAGNVQHIIRGELRLAKAEISDDLQKVKRGALLIAIGALVGIGAIGVAFLAAVYALSLVLPPWAAALIVAAVAGGTAAALAMSGMKQMKDLGLPRTAATIQENVQWAKTHSR